MNIPLWLLIPISLLALVGAGFLVWCATLAKQLLDRWM